MAHSVNLNAAGLSAIQASEGSSITVGGSYVETASDDALFIYTHEGTCTPTLSVTVASPVAKLSKVTGSVGAGYTTKVTDAATGAPLNIGQVAFYGTPGYLCTAQVVNGTATCTIPTSSRLKDLVTQLTKGLGVTGEFDAPGYAGATTTNGLKGAPTID